MGCLLNAGWSQQAGYLRRYILVHSQPIELTKVAILPYPPIAQILPILQKNNYCTTVQLQSVVELHLPKKEIVIDKVGWRITVIRSYQKFTFVFALQVSKETQIITIISRI